MGQDTTQNRLFQWQCWLFERICRQRVKPPAYSSCDSGHGCSIIIPIFALLSLGREEKNTEKNYNYEKIFMKNPNNNDDIKKVCSKQTTATHSWKKKNVEYIA